MITNIYKISRYLLNCLLHCEDGLCHVCFEVPQVLHALFNHFVVVFDQFVQLFDLSLIAAEILTRQPLAWIVG